MHKIFNLLAEKTQDSTYYLKSLNYIEEADLEIYRSITYPLSHFNIQELIEDDNWRSHLVAYMIVLSNKKIELVEVLKNRLLKGSFVSPQIIVSIAILEKRQALIFFKEVIISKDCDSKTYGAILAVLPYLTNKIALPDMQLDLSEFDIGFNVAQQHMKFWKKIEIIDLHQ